MIAVVRNFWRDEAGLILSAELVMILTIGVLGLIVGLVNLQNALLGEFNDLGAAFRSLNQSYGTPTFRGCWKGAGWFTSYSLGSSFIDIYEPGCLLTESSANGAAGCYGLELNSGYGCCLSPVASGACPSATNPGLAAPPLNVPQQQNSAPAPGVDQVLPPRTP